MTESMKVFVAGAIKTILKELHESRHKKVHQRARPLPLNQVPTHQQNKTDKIFALDVSTADDVGAGTKIFYSPMSAEKTWFIFKENASGQRHGDKIFELSGMIENEISTDAIVEKAYEFILMRPVDSNGRNVYTEHLQSGNLSLYEFLKILADCGEAKDLGIKLIIIPQSNTWLHDAGLIMNGGVSVPSLIVRN